MKNSQLFHAIDVSRSACPTCMIGLELSAQVQQCFSSFAYAALMMEQVHLESDQRTLFNDDMHCLRLLAAPYPLAQKMIRRLTVPALLKRFDSGEFYCWSVFFFFFCKSPFVAAAWAQESFYY